MYYETSIDLTKENGFSLKKMSRQYPAETMIDETFTED